MELSIGIVVKPFNCLKEYCRNNRFSFDYRLESPGALPASILNYCLTVRDKSGNVIKSVTALGKGSRSAKENATYKFLRLVGEREYDVGIDDLSEEKNVVTALTLYTQAMQGLTLPQFHFALSETNAKAFVCKCTIAGISCEAEALNQHDAKRQAAFFVLRHIEMNEMGMSARDSVAMSCIMPPQKSARKRTTRNEFDISAVTTYDQFKTCGCAMLRMKHVDMFETQNMIDNIDRFVDTVASELNCTREEYLSTTNYWRLPCKLTQDVDQSLSHELLFELEKRFGIKDLKLTTVFVVNVKNMAIDQGWADISKTPYEFRVWTPCFVDNPARNQSTDRFRIVVDSDDNSNACSTSIVYSSSSGESLLLRHDTKFKLIGPSQVNHFYFVSEWKRNGTQLKQSISSINRKWLVERKDYEKISSTLKLGLEKLRRLYVQYDLNELVDEWLYILELYENASVLRQHPLIDSFVNVALVRQTLWTFRIFLGAKKHHGRNLNERVLLATIHERMVQPIVEYTKRKVMMNNSRFGLMLP